MRVSCLTAKLHQKCVILKKTFSFPFGGGAKKQGSRPEKQNQKDQGGIANTHLDFYFTKKHKKRIFCMNLTVEDYERIHVILGIEKQKVKPTEIKENQ